MSETYVVMKKGYVGVPQKIDTLNTVPIQRKMQVGNYILGVTDFNDAVWVREFYEKLTDQLTRERDSLKAIINKR